VLLETNGIAAAPALNWMNFRRGRVFALVFANGAKIFVIVGSSRLMLGRTFQAGLSSSDSFLRQARFCEGIRPPAQTQELQRARMNAGAAGSDHQDRNRMLWLVMASPRCTLYPPAITLS
jgi:hypothetical protein